MKKEQENKILYAIYIMIGILILNTFLNFIILSKVGTENMKKNNIDSPTSDQEIYDVSMFINLTPSEILKKVKNKEKFILFIGKSDCPYCQKMLPSIQKAQSDYNFKTIYLNAKSIDVDSNDYKELASFLDQKETINGETKTFGEFQLTPMIVAFENGKMKDGIIGYDTYDYLSEFLEKIGYQK